MENADKLGASNPIHGMNRRCVRSGVEVACNLILLLNQLHHSREAGINHFVGEHSINHAALCSLGCRIVLSVSFFDQRIGSKAEHATISIPTKAVVLVDKLYSSFDTLYSAFRSIVSDFSLDERRKAWRQSA